MTYPMPTSVAHQGADERRSGVAVVVAVGVWARAADTLSMHSLATCNSC